MEEKDQETTKDRISKKFEARRKEVSSSIYANIEKLSNLKTLKDAQVNMLSLRQQLLEDNHSLLEHLTSLRKKMREEKAAEMETLSRNLALRYQANEKNMVIDVCDQGIPWDIWEPGLFFHRVDQNHR